MASVHGKILKYTKVNWDLIKSFDEFPFFPLKYNHWYVHHDHIIVRMVFFVCVSISLAHFDSYTVVLLNVLHFHKWKGH